MSAPHPVRYVPAAHVWHASQVVAPVFVWNLPRAHESHALCPSACAKWPVAQAEHTLVQAPLVPLNLPAAQLWHVPLLDAPQPARYVPASHAWHAWQDACPSAHWNLPVAHAEHVESHAAPVPALNVPTAHGVHLPALVPEQPVR